MATAWHTLPASEVAQELGVDPERGLAPEEAERRLAEHGPNELARDEGPAAWSIVWRQITEPLVLVLVVAAAVSAALWFLEAGGEREPLPYGTVAILAIVLLNTVLGFAQEYRAERAVEALRRMTAPACTVRRGSETRRVPSRELVAGDLLLLSRPLQRPASKIKCTPIIVISASLYKHRLEEVKTMRGTARVLTSKPNFLLRVATILLVFAAPAAADSPAERDWGPALAILNGAAAEAVLFGPTAARSASADGPSVLGTVTADCCDGSTVTCEGSSGHFVDADCPNEQGYCYTQEEGTQYCPDCSSPTCNPDDCSSDPFCQSKHGTSCSVSGNGTCEIYGSGGSCGTCMCDGSTWTCPF